MVVVRRKVIKINKINTVFFILFHLLCSYLHFNLFIYFDERDNVFIHDAREYLQFRDDRMDSRGTGGPDFEIFRIADHLKYKGNFRRQ